MSAQDAVDDVDALAFAPVDDVDALAFAPVDDGAIPYVQRTRDGYLALGYDNPYRWAHYQTQGAARKSGPPSP